MLGDNNLNGDYTSLSHNEGSEIVPQRNAANIMRRNFKLAMSALFLAAIVVTALITYFVTKNSNNASNAPCADSDVTGMLTIYSGTVQFPNRSYWRTPTMNSMGEWLCNALLCDQATLDNMVRMTMNFIAQACLHHPSDILGKVNVTQCVRFTAELLPGYAKAGCRSGFNGTLFELFDHMNNPDTGNTTLNQLQLTLRQPGQ